MKYKPIAIALIAALLLTGCATVTSQTPEPAILATEAPARSGSVSENATQTVPEQTAEEAALTHAGLTAQEVTALHSHYDGDDRIPHYDVEFRAGDYEYDYEIDENGTVLEWDREYDPVDPAPAEPAGTLTAEEAKAAALAHAGLTAQEVTALRSHYDGDDRVPHYDVEFRAGDYEYDYEIDENGTVLEWDREYDPVDPAPAEPAGALTAEEAKAAALAHAGLTAEQVSRLRTEYDVDDGIPVYEVDFVCDGWEYEYEIHGETGAILEWDKEYDD